MIPRMALVFLLAWCLRAKPGVDGLESPIG